ncbi:Eco57I restriction-modification methylase domain-containing protein [Mycoplasma crocodyli]|uniref:Eco57I restriction-modification methylase domain-containing protein n=1 Tax=Mycoplasma crocodyli TaxID=50052 RepID=UPI001EE5ED55|nr:Eco57I restriction-modification methylase domain-containing protein [Mycoplasma crocodyli]
MLKEIDDKYKKEWCCLYTNQYCKKILNESGYFGENILKKHVIDNSCGDGRFLEEIVKTYIKEFFKIDNDLIKLKNQLEHFIHGIEIDLEECKKCINNLNLIIKEYNIDNVNWDIIVADTLDTNIYTGKMDFVLGNPPYVRVHNFDDRFSKIKNKRFTKKGMTDLFILFYEIGLNMLNEKGVLCYITPSSIFNSFAGLEFRKFIIQKKLLKSVIDYKHYQVFESVSTYTTILKLDKNNTDENINYFSYNDHNQQYDFIDKLEYNDFFINNSFYFQKKEKLVIFKKIINCNIKQNNINVKNGFATLCDDIFIKDHFEFKSKHIFNVLKSSRKKWKKIIFPYNKEGALITFECLEKELQDYLTINKDRLLNRSFDKGQNKWYAFGRSQAINDFWKEKISINNLIKTKENLKIELLKSGEGVYSGLYIIGNFDLDKIKQILISDEFIEYISLISKYKANGYYTFSSSDLKKYLVYKLGV